MDDDSLIANNADNHIPPLPEDNDPPASAADDESPIDPTHQVTDSNIQFHEAYDEGLSGAAEATDPSKDNAVTGYNPENDSRKNNDNT